jgi:hypothetical protein
LYVALLRISNGGGKWTLLPCLLLIIANRFNSNRSGQACIS